MVRSRARARSSGGRVVAAVVLAWGLLGCRDHKQGERPGVTSEGAATGRKLKTPGDMPKAAAAVLERPERFEIFTLNPSPPPDDDPPDPGWPRLHGVRITGRHGVADAGMRERVVATIYEGIRSSDGSLAMCFHPHHGVRATREGKTVELVICYECRQVKVYGPGGGEETLPTSPKVEAELDRLFDAVASAPRPASSGG